MFFDQREIVNHVSEVVISGPLFKKNGKPVGWFAHNGRQIGKPVNPSKVGGNFAGQNAFLIQKKDGSIDIIPYDKIKKTDFNDVQFGFQNGRQLLFEENGETINKHNPNSPNRHDRIGIGYVEGTHEVIIIQKEECTYYELAEELKKQGATEAIYLDGFAVMSIDDMKKYEQGKVPDNAYKIHFH